MRTLPIDLTVDLKMHIAREGLLAFVDGRESLLSWEGGYSPDEDIWARGEDTYVDKTGVYLLDKLSNTSFNPRMWLGNLGGLVEEIEKRR